MFKSDRSRHHAQRAMEELERAQAADSMEAAIAHLDLSELHLARMKAADDESRAHLRLVA